MLNPNNLISKTKDYLKNMTAKLTDYTAGEIISSVAFLLVNGVLCTVLGFFVSLFVILSFLVIYFLGSIAFYLFGFWTIGLILGFFFIGFGFMNWSNKT